jgi:hypothetical protein
MTYKQTEYSYQVIYLRKTELSPAVNAKICNGPDQLPVQVKNYQSEMKMLYFSWAALFTRVHVHGGAPAGAQGQSAHRRHEGDRKVLKNQYLCYLLPM